MPTVEISRKTLATLPAVERPTVFFDDTLKGFGLAARPTGARSWIVEYRPGAGGRGVAKKRVVIGSPDSMTPEAARDAAADMLARVRLGADPAAERAEARAADTVAEIAAEWLARHVRPKRKPETLRLYTQVLNLHILPAIGTRKAVSVTRSDVGRLHTSIATKAKGAAKPGSRRTPPTKERGGPVIANRALAVLKAMFTWAAEMGHLPEGHPNPGRGVEAFRERPRETFLDDAQMARLGDALRLAETEGLPWTVDESSPGAKHAPKPENRVVRFDLHSVGAIRLLLLTGARRSEILNLKWADVDWSRGMLRLGDSKSGPKVIVLGAAALAVLDALPRVGKYVIASTSAGTANEKPRADVNRLWRAVTCHAGLEGTRIHDLRHSAAAIGAGAGLSLHQIGAMLGHRQASTTRRYSHLAADPQRRAADVVGGQVAAALGLPGEDVVRLEGRRKA